MGHLTTEDIDPFTQIYNGILQALQSSRHLTPLVKLPNYINYQGEDQKKLINTRASADTPELELFHDNGAAFLHATSSMAKCEHSLSLLVTTNDLRAQNKYNPIKWFAMLALGKFVDARLKLPFVQKAELANYVDRPNKVQDDKDNITGWKGLLTIQVTFFFDLELFS